MYILAVFQCCSSEFMKKILFLVLILALGQVCFAYPMPNSFPAFHIAGNLYYVGTDDLANYLIVTPKGNILINSDLEANVPMIKASIEKLGFKFSDTKILLISHAHLDHAEGSKLIKELTKAKYMVMDADVAVIQSGGKADFNYGKDPSMRFPPAKVDQVLHDGDQVKLGGTVLTAHLTPGHTKGCTTWAMEVMDQGKKYQVVIVGSLNVNPGYKLVRNTTYPNLAEDYKRAIKILKSLPCDIFLGAHARYFDLKKKYNLLNASSGNPFVDSRGYKTHIAEKEKEFYTELKKQSGNRSFIHYVKR
jgi:metallo-beta-lactamase class B